MVYTGVPSCLKKGDLATGLFGWSGLVVRCRSSTLRRASLGLEERHLRYPGNGFGALCGEVGGCA
ncbi:hypothetical protein Caka_0331 [Coraliomargarita akajimensis DSM 45221]|uniref:Uncharacterized protein n=1 Tax=Coraliomargarita akajimensis (strain DSM 45221 / IAM 15411 / JCM 23193 / KCTC 12865 / 04OKA010-24) TaxID=583355 RepID=D5EMF0_CORAD|nr:hypothetical protein Caka_0331 [Coraliomargarita akajimensis DSM 45221]